MKGDNFTLADFLHMVNIEVCAAALPHVEVRMGKTLWDEYSRREGVGLYWKATLDESLPPKQLRMIFDGEVKAALSRR